MADTDEGEVARIQGVMQEVFADGDNGGYRMDEDGQIISKAEEKMPFTVAHNEAEAARLRAVLAKNNSHSCNSASCVVCNWTPAEEEAGSGIVASALEMMERYEERVKRQAASLSSLIAKYWAARACMEAVIAVAEELIHDFDPEHAEDMPAHMSYYQNKLEAAKRTGDDVGNGKTA
jgi:hypothetical protein